MKDQVHNSTVPDSYPLLPIEIQIENKAVHFYTGACGRHMSVRILGTRSWDNASLFAFHEGKFDKYNPKIPNIFVKYNDQLISSLLPPSNVLGDTEATYKLLPDDVLDTITSIDDIPHGVISRDNIFFSFH